MRQNLAPRTHRLRWGDLEESRAGQLHHMAHRFGALERSSELDAHHPKLSHVLQSAWAWV
jgi:hypothetical protein